VTHVTREARRPTTPVHHAAKAAVISARFMAIGPGSARSTHRIRQRQLIMPILMPIHNLLF